MFSIIEIMRRVNIKNRVFDLGEHSVIEVYNRGHQKYFYVFIDTEDLELVKSTARSITAYANFHSNYCTISRKDTKKLQPLHRLIMNTPDGMVVDHINHNGLDNRKKNLRNCTKSENAKNKRFGYKNKLHWSNEFETIYENQLKEVWK
jgi:hypothetical protein